MPPDEPNDEEALEELPGDGETPFRPANDTPDDPDAEDPLDRVHRHKFDDTHPATDSNLDSHELYDEGVAGAAEVDEP